jgi:hypothetical protein
MFVNEDRPRRLTSQGKSRARISSFESTRIALSSVFAAVEGDLSQSFATDAAAR